MTTDSLTPQVPSLSWNPSVPGSVLGILRQGRRSIEARGVCGSSGIPVAADTIFDLASVTKVVATTCVLHRLARVGKISLDDPVSRYLPWSPGPALTTVRTMAYHRAGLWEWQPLYLAETDPLTTIATLPLRYEPGAHRHYSDLGFMLLGLLVETVMGSSLDAAFTELIARPLNLAHTGYAPVIQPSSAPVILTKSGSPAASPSSGSVASSGWGDTIEQQMVATSTPYPVLFHNPSFPWRTNETIGEANDGNAFHCFSGVAGHAGLFSCADDLLTLLDSLSCEDPLWGDCTSIFADGPDEGQGFGWRTMLVRLDGETHQMVWHPGFTGCAVGLVPRAGFAIVLLTNRLLADDPPTTTWLWEQALNHVDALSEWRIP